MTPLAEQATPLMGGSGNRAVSTDRDVLANRIESAALIANQEKLSPTRKCAVFFGTCWYIALPVGAAIITGAYLLIAKVNRNLPINRR